MAQWHALMINYQCPFFFFNLCSLFFLAVFGIVYFLSQILCEDVLDR